MQDEVIPQTQYLDLPSSHPPHVDEDQSTSVLPKNSFLAIVYPERNRATQILKALKKMQSPKLIDLEDAVYVTRDKKGRTRLQELGRRRKKNTIGDSIVGLVAGSLLLTPIGGETLAEATPTVTHKVADVHIEGRFIEELRSQMEPNSSTIFLLVRKASPTEVVPRLTPYGGAMLETSITRDEQAHLQAALKAAQVH